MYSNYDTQKLSDLTTKAAAEADQYGVYVFVESDPDWCGPDIHIDPQDTAGIAIFREFAQKMADHYKNLKS